MSKKSVKRNYIYNLIYQVLIMIIPLITTPYLSRVLGAENIGIYSYTLSIATYFILFGSLGVSMYGQREIAYAQDDIQKRSYTFFEILIMRFITLSISMVLFYITFCIQGEYNVYYKILILEIIANAIDIGWYFQGLEEFKKTVVRNTLVKMVSVVLIFILVRDSEDLNKYFVIYVLSTLLGNLSLWFYLPKYIKKVKIKKLNILKHLKPTLMLFLPQIATQVYTVLDKTMIGTIVSDKTEVGYYEQAQKIIKLLIVLVTSLGTVMVPRIAATYAKGDKNRIKEYMKKSFSFTLLLAFPLMLGIISVSSKFVPLFFGEGYDKVSLLICVISPIVVFIGLSNVIGVQYFLTTKKQNKFTISVIIGAVVNFVLNIILIHCWKSIGASIATVAAEFAVTFTQFVLVRREIKVVEVIKISFKYIIASIIMFLLSMMLGYFIQDNLLSIIVQISVSVVIYGSMLLILKDKMIYEGINILKQKFKKSEVKNEV